MKNIIIAGAAGSLGQYLQRRYLENNFNIISVSRKKNNQSKIKNLYTFNEDLSNKKKYN